MQFRGLALSLLSLVELAALALGFAPLSAAQQRSGGAGAVTLADYQNAEKFLPYNTRPLVFHEVRATWLQGDRFWYRDAGPNGIEFTIYDAVRGTRQPAFSHAKVAAALSAAAGRSYDAAHLPFMTFEFSPDEKAISFTLLGQDWKCDLLAGSCTAEGKPSEPGAQAWSGREISRRQEHRIHSRLESSGARRGQRQRDTTHHRWREGFRVCDRQRGLDS